jgi:hypothetical protein
MVGYAETIVGTQALPPGQRPHVLVVGNLETEPLRAVWAHSHAGRNAIKWRREKIALDDKRMVKTG